MIRELGRDCLCPFSPAASSSEAMEAACPQQRVLMGLRMYCIALDTSKPLILIMTRKHHWQSVVNARMLTAVLSSSSDACLQRSDSSCDWGADLWN